MDLPVRRSLSDPGSVSDPAISATDRSRGIWRLAGDHVDIRQRLAQATRPAIGHLATIAVGLVFATVWPLAINTEPSPRASFESPAQTVWAMRLAHNPVVLLAVPADREGSAVAELALHDPNRPSMFAIRGSRLLGGGGYNNQDYLPLYDNEAEVSKAIDRYAIPFVLLSTRHSPGEWKHVRQVQALAARSRPLETYTFMGRRRFRNIALPNYRQ